MKGWKFMGAFYAITLFVFLISLPPDNVVYLFPPPPQPNEAIEVCFVVNPPIKSLYFHPIQSALLISSEKKCETKKTTHNLRSTTTATVFLRSPNLLLSEQALNSSPHATLFMSIYPLSIISEITPWCQSLINQTIRDTTRFYLLRILSLLPVSRSK